MTERLVTFENVRIGVDPVSSIGAVPDESGKLGRGVGEDMKLAFGYKGNDYGDLLGVMAPHRELQKDIAFIKETLSDPEVQARIGEEGKTAIEIARSWAERTRLQAQLFRPVMEPLEGDVEQQLADLHFDVAVIPDRVPNWLERMGDLAITIGRTHPIDLLAMPSSDREIGPDEKPGVAEGTKAESYMEQTLQPRLEQGRTRAEIAAGETDPAKVFGSVEIDKTGEKAGDDVMKKGAAKLALRGVDLETATILVLAVAGNAMQSGAQTRNGLQSVYPDFDRNPQKRQLWVAADGFPLGETGEEPKHTHQNPFSAAGGNIGRALLYAEQLVLRA